MKKYVLLTAILLPCVLLAGCGEKENAAGTWQGIAPGMDLAAVTERTEYYDVTVEAEELFTELRGRNPEEETAELAALQGGTGYVPLGTQFLKGEPVQLWAELSREGMSLHSDIYLYRRDGGPELLLQGVPASYTATGGYRWYADRDGGFYCYRTIYPEIGGEYRAQSTLMRLLPSGEALYTKTLADTHMKGICQLEDGRVYLLLKDASVGTWYLAELDPATGEPLPDTRIEVPCEYDVSLGEAGGSPAVTGYGHGDIGNKVTEVDTASGALSPVLYFTGTSYGWHTTMELRGLQVLGDGQVELLWTDFDGLGGLWERLRMGKVEKIPIVVRGVYNDSWLADRIARFNRESSAYHVVMEACGVRNDREDFARLTSVQVGAGKGPDILSGDLGLDYAGMVEKGALEELNPYMEASGIREDDYFPIAFATWRQGEGIYGVSYRMLVQGEQIDRQVLGSREVPGIEALADALLALEGDGVYRSGYESGEVLGLFLQGTESLWGMVDWEGGSCDFNTPLFGKLLEAAKRHGDDGRKATESSITKFVNLDSFFSFNGQKEQEAKGKVTSGVLFDDGCHAAASSWYTLAINANSPHKEGAWEFLSYLIGEECQDGELTTLVPPPVHRGAFAVWLQGTIEKLGMRYYVNGVRHTPAYYGRDISEEKQAEYIKALEDARPLPLRTAPILTIIQEEAADYFSGIKSVEEVSRVVNNRVQLYLDERK